MPMDIVDRMFDLIDAKYKDQKDFAKDIGVDPSHVSRWRNRKTTSFQRRLTKISETLGTTSEYLLTGEGPKKKTAPVTRSDLPKGAIPIDPSAYHCIPILGRISAGLPLYAEQHIEGYTVTDLNGGAEYFALRVHGDSMNALGINDGYIIIVRRQDEVENGQIAVVMVGDEDATVKRFYATGSTVTLMPQSTNPEHQPQIYDTAKMPIRVIGRVVEVKFTL